MAPFAAKEETKAKTTKFNEVTLNGVHSHEEERGRGEPCITHFGTV